MKIKLLHATPLWLCSNAIRMSHDNHHLSDSKDGEIGPKDYALIQRVGNKLKHKSVLEQIVMFWEIDGISRACLQELARHRTARLTVKSTRYTLKELKKYDYDKLYESKEEFVVFTGNPDIDYIITAQLQDIRTLVSKGVSNDIVKMALPESFKTKLQWQIDMRNFQSFLELRTSKEAHWEIRELAYALYESLPEEYQNLCKEYVHGTDQDL